ncbi:carbohydrate ABC transporter substrate-binding protein [Streptomyces sp. MAG02]|nr:carbohydrate ABC transporter substrate-binding protein [Streptomyces sp. MAG02]
MVGLAASAATVPLAACSPGSRTTASTSGGAGKASGVIKVAAFENAYGAAIYKQVAEAFEKATGAKVELTVSKTIDQELTPQVAAGNFPDVVFMGVGGKTGFTDKFVQNKSLEPLNDILKITNKGETTTVGDKLLPGMVGNLTTNPYDDDRLMLAPTFMAPAGLVYNKTLFTKNGWTLPATWDEFFALGDEVKAKGISLFTYPTAGYFDTFFFALLSSIGGDDYFKKVMSYEKNIWTGSEATQVLNLVGKLLTQYTLPQTVGYANNQDYTKNQAALMVDKALFCPDGSWVAGEMKDAPRSAGFAWGLTTVPAMKKKTGTSLALSRVCGSPVARRIRPRRKPSSPGSTPTRPLTYSPRLVQQCLPRPEQRACWPKWHPSIPSTTSQASSRPSVDSSPPRPYPASTLKPRCSTRWTPWLVENCRSRTGRRRSTRPATSWAVTDP